MSTDLSTAIDMADASHAEGTTKRKTSLIRALFKHPTGAPSLYFLLLVIAVAIVAPWATPHDPALTDASNVMAPMSMEHWLGGDPAGRDVLSRLMVATTYSLAGGVIVAVVAALLGVTGGLIAGYFGGWIDAVGAWVTALMMSVPALVILLAARAAFGPSLWISMTIFGVLLSPMYYRVVYNAVRAVTQELYIDAARVTGLSTPRIISRHVLQAVRAPIILLSSGILAAGIGMMAILDFLGLGSPATPSWGQLLNTGFYQLTVDPKQVIWPSVTLGLTMMALVLLGTALRDELEGTSDVRATRSHRPWTPESEAVPSTINHSERQSTETSLLDVKDLAVAYPSEDGTWTTVVRRSTLTVARGEIHGLVGESGSGKTQTAFAILGLLGEGGRRVAGTISFDGEELQTNDDTEMNKLRGRRIAYVPQEPMSNLNPAFTVGAQFTDPLRVVLGLSKEEARARALTLLERVGITDPEQTMRSYPHELSGGMAQRVLIAAAVASHPDLLIADEPTTALDVTVQAEVLDLLREFRDELGMSILIVTHSLGVVADLCDHVSVMRQGAVVESGPTSSIFAAPRHEYTRQLFSAVPKGEPRGPWRPTLPLSNASQGATS